MMENLTDEQLQELAREKQREYQRNWRAKPENKKKIKKYNETYWKKRALRELEEETK